MKIKIEKFEGPLSLLLKMIEQEELDITEINLAGIADQYIEYIKNNNNISPDNMADFLVIAAKLLFIKSKALLPYIYAEEEEDLEDLEKQLKMYKEFLEAAKKIEKMLGKKKFMFAREFNRKVALANTHSFSPPKKLQISDILETFKDLLLRIKPAEKHQEELFTEIFITKWDYSMCHPELDSEPASSINLVDSEPLPTRMDKV